MGTLGQKRHIGVGKLFSSFEWAYPKNYFTYVGTKMYVILLKNLEDLRALTDLMGTLGQKRHIGVGKFFSSFECTYPKNYFTYVGTKFYFILLKILKYLGALTNLMGTLGQKWPKWVL